MGKYVDNYEEFEDQYQDYLDGDSQFKASELYFSIGVFEDEDPPIMVTLCPIDYWEEEHHIADFIGGYNVNNDDLRKGGLCEAELQESIFEPLPLNEVDHSKPDWWDNIEWPDKEYLHQKLLDAGFKFSQEMDDYMNSFLED